MTTIKRSLGWAYRDKGDYRTAARYFEQLAVLRDSIKNREQKSAALELAAVYETNEKDLFIQQQAADMQKEEPLIGIYPLYRFSVRCAFCGGRYGITGLYVAKIRRW